MICNNVEQNPPSFLLVQHKSCEHSIFPLPLALFIGIIDYNAVCGAVIATAAGTIHKKSCHAQGFCYTGRRIIMAVSYKKLWKLLIDKDIKKKDLSAKAGVSPATITKMGKGGHVTTEVLLKICTALNCTVDDILEIIEDVR